MAYSPVNHYWFVGSVAATKIFSSAKAAYVDVTDATYTAWVEAGGSASLINDAGELAMRLVAEGVPDATVLAVAVGRSPTESLRVMHARGLRLTSTATPALAGVYSVHPAAQQVIAAIYAGIKGGDGLPGGGATFYYQDQAGVPHAFTAEQFSAFAKVVRDYLYQLSLAVAMPTPVWPNAAVTIS